MIQDIVDLVSRQHFQIACQRYFEATHHAEVDGGIQHPNQYFQESQKILNGDVKENRTASNKGANKVPTTRVTVPIKSESSSSQPAEEVSQMSTVEATLDSDDDHHFDSLDV